MRITTVGSPRELANKQAIESALHDFWKEDLCSCETASDFVFALKTRLAASGLRIVRTIK